MRIGEVAKATGLTAATIRLYEKSNMLPAVKRGPDGHRAFTLEHVEWLTLLYWLRETGMSVHDMRRFTALAKAGETGLPERREILETHAATLKARREAIDRCESILAVKMARYGSDKGAI